MSEMTAEPTVERLTFTVREVAERLGVGTRLIERMCQSGELAHLRLGRRILIPAATVEALVTSAQESK